MRGSRCVNFVSPDHAGLWTKIGRILLELPAILASLGFSTDRETRKCLSVLDRLKLEFTDSATDRDLQDDAISVDCFREIRYCVVKMFRRLGAASTQELIETHGSRDKCVITLAMSYSGDCASSGRFHFCPGALNREGRGFATICLYCIEKLQDLDVYSEEEALFLVDKLRNDIANAG